ncbi:hypothetical protein NC653_009590 [Populus alba x Populus x berolinensis]|uniref:Uncharacterized protein n=1 Tax=Populus alba x Populus x berolinensis TaxID=444605 RepID=A0AAD6R9S3_9ROSI|nr:hypothetical protein NC653_009590 [Populus alba x Populus x berolinensis]
MIIPPIYNHLLIIHGVNIISGGFPWLKFAYLSCRLRSPIKLNKAYASCVVNVDALV